MVWNKFHLLALSEVNPLVADEFPSQRAGNAELILCCQMNRLLNRLLLARILPLRAIYVTK